MAQLLVFFTLEDSGQDIAAGRRTYWTVPGAAKEEDLGLIYISEQRELVAIARLTSPPFRDKAHEFGWGEGAWWAKVTIARVLAQPIPLAAMKPAAARHGWKAWKVLRGRRHIVVPSRHHTWLRRFVASYDSVAGKLLGADEGARPPELPDAGTAAPPRGTWTISRVVRDTRIGRVLKARYDGACQVCSAQLTMAPGQFYSEAHHLKPLGRPHNGPDTFSNVLVLCPTHHAEFDLALIAPHPRTLRLQTIHPRHPHRGRVLRLEPFHLLDKHYLQHHLRRFKRMARQFTGVRH
jgi:hypothetical protein